MHHNFPNSSPLCLINIFNSQKENLELERKLLEAKIEQLLKNEK